MLIAIDFDDNQRTCALGIDPNRHPDVETT